MVVLFVYSGIHPLCRCMSLFLMMILPWSTTLKYKCTDCWTWVQEEPYLPHSALQSFSLLFFIMHPQYFLSKRASALVHPHCWAILLLTIENMCLATNFTRWEGYIRKDVSGVSSSSFPLGDLKTWTWATLDEFLSTTHIVLSSLLIMTSMTKSDYRMHPLPSLELQQPP